MKISSSAPLYSPALRSLPRHPAAPVVNSPTDSSHTSTAARCALVAGVAAASGAGLALAAGMQLGQTLNLAASLAVLGVMGAALWPSADPKVALQPELDTLLVGRFNDDQKQQVQKALNALGPGNVQRLKQANVRLVVAGDRVPRKAAACYFAGEKLAAFRRYEVSRNTVVHELGHALDNLALPAEFEGKAHFRSQIDGELLGNYNGYMARTHSDQPQRKTVWSDYAQTNEREYLAEGVTWYLQNAERNAELLQKDPGHHAYVQRFLTQG